ncbi:uncharacterized protein LOC102705062 isoform X1 [Oryza brachyantha]|uniref:uncharacterized protein LOC102705062 isoform X1 n=1 Tax=Oryza brachyantha TaxID=4533 RepID=UPI001ADA678C|nr:uncharacterized protein LOC102705062 isoform X1 [Oryza brachyantha]
MDGSLTWQGRRGLQRVEFEISEGGDDDELVGLEEGGRWRGAPRWGTPVAASPRGPPRRRWRGAGRELPRGSAAAVRHEGWMLRYGRRKIGRSFVRTRYFVLDNKLFAYYKRQPKENVVPVKALQIDGNCRVEDRGLKTYHGQMVYVLCIYNKKEKEDQITSPLFHFPENYVCAHHISNKVAKRKERYVAGTNWRNRFGLTNKHTCMHTSMFANCNCLLPQKERDLQTSMRDS